MKKRLIAGTMSALLALSLAACGDDAPEVDDDTSDTLVEDTVGDTDTSMADTSMAEDTTETSMTDET